MNSYPRIYSISTVGVRQHENADYLLHPVRTDFTGNNGLGKSIIADLLQLILVPLRDEWKPGTEGLDKDKRKIESIPLEKPWIQHAYSFLNIEKSKGMFITIGVFIPNNSRVPVRPFIIQKGDDFETKGVKLKTFVQILKAEDFISENNHIFDLRELSRSLYETHGIHLKDYYARDGVNSYHDVLYKNNLISIDLSREINLKSFAKVIQSFSRAKTLDINKSKSLQDFLFEDNDDIKQTFEEKKETLTEHIRNFHNANKEIASLKQKQGKLDHLSQTNKAYETAKQEYLSKNALYLFNKYNIDKKVFDENEAKKDKANNEYSKAKSEYESQCIESYNKMQEQKNICNEIRLLLEENQENVGKSDIVKLKEELRIKSNLIEKLEMLELVVSEFGTIDNIKSSFNNHEKQKEEKNKLEKLKGLELFNKFKDSKWSENYHSAYTFYNQRTQDIDKALKTLNELSNLYEGNNPDSFFNWVIKNSIELNREQETVVMAFKVVFTKKIEANEGTRFITNPNSLINSYTKDGDGIWIHLGDISEYHSLIDKQIFNDKEKLIQALENDKEKILNEIKELKLERVLITNLNTGLINIGYNEAYVEIYHRREELENFQSDKLYTEDNIDFIIKHYDLFDKIDSIKQESIKLDEQINKMVSAWEIIKKDIESNNKVLTTLFIKINDIKAEIIDLKSQTKINLDALALNELINLRNENENEIPILERVRINTRNYRDNQKNILDTCMINTITFKEAQANSFNSFNEAKKILEAEIDIKFDTLLPLGNLSQETVDNLKTLYETKKNLYQTEYISVAGLFEESKPDSRNPEIYKPDGLPYFSFQALINILCGKIGLKNLTGRLSELNDNLKELGELQLKILTEVFSIVEKQYRDNENIVIRLNQFFAKNTISDSFRFKIEFTPRTDIKIDWIGKMKEKARVSKFGADLFSNNLDISSEENTPMQLISNIANYFYSSVKADLNQLLDPKFYFSLKVEMVDADGKANSGSGGQAYTALALLCIGRLSIVQKNQEMMRQGVKFIIIEELSNIDDTNFNIFPAIARQFGYQLITMTPKPFGSYTDEEWFLHILIKGKEDKDRNYTPMSFFKTKSSNMELNTYINSQNELEAN